VLEDGEKRAELFEIHGHFQLAGFYHLHAGGAPA